MFIKIKAIICLYPQNPRLIWAKFARPVIVGRIVLIREVKNKDLREESDQKGISRNFLDCNPGVYRR